MERGSLFTSHKSKGIAQLAICVGWATYTKIRLFKTKDMESF